MNEDTEICLDLPKILLHVYHCLFESTGSTFVRITCWPRYKVDVNMSKFVYKYVYKYICIYINIYICIYIYIYVYVYIDIYIYMYMLTQVKRIGLYVHMYMCM